MPNLDALGLSPQKQQPKHSSQLIPSNDLNRLLPDIYSQHHQISSHLNHLPTKPSSVASSTINTTQATTLMNNGNCIDAATATTITSSVLQTSTTRKRKLPQPDFSGKQIQSSIKPEPGIQQKRKFIRL